MKGHECCFNEWKDERTGMLLRWMNGWKDRNVVGMNEWMNERTGMLLERIKGWKDRSVIGMNEWKKSQECCWNGWMDEMTWFGLDDKTSFVFNT